MEELQIIGYDDKYKEEIVEFIKGVAINEFGFEEWRNYLDHKSFEPYKKEGSKFWIVINSSNKIIGTCGALKESEETLKLNSFYMSHDYREHGLGSKVYKLMLEYATESNYKSIILCTYEKFDIAVQFYEKRGFKIYKIEDNGEMWYKKEL